MRGNWSWGSGSRWFESPDEGKAVGQMEGAIGFPAVAFDFSFEEVGEEKRHVGVFKGVLFVLVDRSEPVTMLEGEAFVSFVEPFLPAVEGDGDGAVFPQESGAFGLDGAVSQTAEIGEFDVKLGLGIAIAQSLGEQQRPVAIGFYPLPGLELRQDSGVDGGQIERSFSIGGGENMVYVVSGASPEAIGSLAQQQDNRSAAMGEVAT